MTTKHSYTYFIWILLVVVAGSCNDPYNDNLDKSKINFVKTTTEKTALDEWIFENFTAGYNIEVKYRWDASETDLNKTLVPPDPGNVQEIMNVARKVWMEPYIAEAGETFLKTFTPKQFVLVGSPNFNTDGTITLGTAEGGRKIVLYTVNDFEDADRRQIKEQMHTVHHEFAHILHQNILYAA